MIKNCLFDFDGTLVDSLKDVFESLTRAFATCGISGAALNPDIIMQRQLPDAIRIAAPEIDDEQGKKVIAAFIDHYDNSGFPNTRLMPGTVELLEGLAGRGVPCFIVSNKRSVPMFKLLSNLKIKKYFTDFFNPDMFSDPTVKKTKSELIAALIKKHALPKAETACIGDMEADVVAAKENGLVAVAVENGYGNADDYKVRPDYVISGISEVMGIVH